MIYLGNGDTLVIANPGALATKSHVSYADASGTTLSGAPSNVSSSAASITALSGAAAGARNVRHWSVTNEGALAGSYSLNHVSGGVTAPLYKAVIQPGQTLSYTEGKGFELSSAVSSTLRHH